jgi:hypothetical protein
VLLVFVRVSGVWERTWSNENCALINDHVEKKKWHTCLLVSVVMLYDKRRRRRDGGTNCISRTEGQETRLTLHEHHHDDNNDDDKSFRTNVT